MDDTQGELLSPTVELKEQLASKTIELERTQHELCIEAALENVRLAGMRMRKPGELAGIATLIFKELGSLGFTDLRNTEIIINNNARQTIVSYYSDYGVTGNIEIDYTTHGIVKKWSEQLRTASDAFAEVAIAENEMEAWRKYRESLGYLPDVKLNEATNVYYYSYSIGLGALSISSFKPVSPDQINILKRFRNVFELCYQRYNDIALAEAQAKDARIETALEKVRSRSMAMHNSSELHDVIKVVTEQLLTIGMQFEYALFCKVDEAGDWHIYVSTAQQAYPAKIHFPYFDNAVFNRFNERAKTDIDFFTDLSTAEEKNIFFQRFFEFTEARIIPQERQKYILDNRGMARSFFRLTNIWFTMGKYDDHPFSDEENKIFKRFATVFDQSYTRFLDLQKAEAQTREAEIELALERVRARTMAMQHQNDLLEVTDLFADQLIGLGVDLDIVNFSNGLSYGDWDLWITGPKTETERVTYRVTVPWFDHPFFHRSAVSLDNFKKGIDLSVEVFSKDEKDAFLSHIFQKSSLNVYPDEAKEYLYSKPGFVWSTVVLKDTWVAICKYDTQPFTAEQNTIIKRFANAFGQAYTRFLDLEKAEAQAREAQIQLSLERVRARAMAMHNTDELNEVLSVLFDQFDVLEIHPLTTSLALIDLEKNSFTFRMTGKQGKRNIGAHEFKLDAVEQWQQAAERWKKSEPDAINCFEFPKEILPHLWELFSEVFEAMPEDARPTLADVPNGIYTTEGYCKFGYLGFSHTRKATEEEKTIVLRFAREFGTVYQRFLDLQKAEAQAREAQIEAGLERVRYSAMAMQSSEEVSAATAVVFHEISTLGIETMRCGITILHDDGTADVWVATASPQGNQMSGIGTIPLSLHPLWTGMYNAWMEKKDDFNYALKGEDLKNYYKIVAQLTTYSATYTTNQEWPAHDHYFYGSCFEQGALFTFSLQPHDEEKRKILRRFTSVFSFTFRRYLDLKHAEAQAREAQIQLGLERVRARTMAMHDSAEINAITGTLFNELIRLDFVLTRCLILIIDPQTRSSRWFMANPEEPLEPRDYFVPYHEHPGYLFLLKGWEERASKWIYLNEGALKKDWDEFFFSETEMSLLPDSVKAGMRTNKRAFVNSSFGTFGGLVVGSPEALGDNQFEILKRFTKVFEQSYTRFLDLQKSEAQAREAQIEAALERVRSSSLAMHHSEQLREVVKVVFEKLKELDFAIDGAAFIATRIRHSRDMNIWIGDDHGEYPGCFRTPFYETPIITDIWNAYNAGLDFYSRSYSFEEKNAWFEFAFEHTDYRHLPEELKNWILGQDFLTQSFALSKNSIIGIHFHHEKTLSEKEIDILKRFSKVFEQGYIRFLDLQKAEAQAREAEIELALERVRARTMSMQTSRELEQVMHTVFERLKELNVDFYTAIIIVFQEGSKDVLWWLENRDHHHFAKILIQYTDTAYLRDLANARESGKDFFTKHYPFEEKNDLFRHLFNHTGLKDTPEEQKAVLLEAPFATMSVGLAKNTAIHITSYSRKSFDDRENDIVKRFAKVFDHGYTRFLDLQTAEAQAREGQIQLALERVRARTMAMQRSDELSETAYLLFQQFTQLGISAIQITIGIMKEAQGVMEFRVTDWGGTGSKVNAGFEVSIDEPTVINKIYKAWKRKDTSIVIDLTSGELEAWLQYRNKVSGVEVTSTETAGRRLISVALFSKGMLAFSTALPPSPETVSILEKFAGVFDLTYTRFLDLQNAEASAREAQIEAALEKVRSSTMAMHKSEDLSKTAAVLFAQLSVLGNTPDRMSIGVMDEPAGVADMWLTDQSGNQIVVPYRVSLEEPTTIRKVFDCWKAGLKSTLIDLSGEELKAWLKYVRQIGLTVKDEYFKNRRVHNVAFFSHGWLNISSLEPLPADMMNVLERFAAVYSLTYRRFIDLQKAEAQARESQIQLALERVRARTMAMHKSEELAETALLLDQQLNHLGVVPVRSMIAIVHEQEKVFDWWMTQPGGKQIEKQVSTPITGHPALGKMFGCWQEQKGSMILNFHEKELSGWLNYVRTEMKLTVNEKLIEGRTTDTIIAPFKYGIVAFVVPGPNSEETISVIERCAGVFNLTYGRFLDLQKAERQARAAQIEASLERVRSKTMAMHNSNDVGETVAATFAEFAHLDIRTNRCGILIFGEENIAEVWTARAMREGPAKLITGKLNVDAHRMLRSVYDAWKAKEWFHQYDLADDDLKDYYNAINKEKYYPTKFDLNALPSKEFHSDFFFPDGAVFSFTNEPIPEEHKKIIKRFASVFGQTYRRYLDLRTAEAQAREAQIEASLERVRSKTMAMHTSQDVADTVAAMFDELTRLNVQTIRCGIGIMHEPNELEVWTAKPSGNGKADLVVGHLDTRLHPLLAEGLEGWKNKKKHFSYELKGDDLDKYFSAINNYPGYPVKYDIKLLPPQVIHNDFYFSEGTLFAFSVHHLPHEASEILKRFASVFGQTYRRYLDLQKAEAQAKEAKIEAALERIRARALAMHSSAELVEVAAVLREQMISLGQNNLEGSAVHLYEEDPDNIISWHAVNPVSEADENVLAGVIRIPKGASELGREMLESFHNKRHDYTLIATGKKLREWREIANASPELQERLKQSPKKIFYHCSDFSGGSLVTFTFGEPSEESAYLQRRAANVFDLAYKRFLDLKNAEAQAREATIEAALEKVRGKAMAMHNSNDLSVTASMVFTELRKLGINPIRCGVGLLNRESRKAQLYSATSSNEGDSLSLVGSVELSGHPVLEKIYDTWLKNEDYYPELSGEQLTSYYKFLLKGLPVPVPDSKDIQKKEYGTFLYFSVGGLFTWSANPYNEAEIRILKRFATIIDLTFRRYIELQKSEANAREAVKQAALDRIRADIASMRTVGDLDRITPLIWNELTILGLPFIRCGVFIMDDTQQMIHTFLSTPDGKAIAAFHMPYDTPGNIKEVISHWRDKKSYVDHWDEAAFTVLADLLVQQGSFRSREQYINTLPHGGFYLHFLPFLQGMLYVGNTTRLSEEQIALIQSVADAFSTAYARYEDFNKLEAAKQQVDKTLINLKQAQQQLVQSEKMASLGELTAGIAHEIQNPLNFVNNFSEVTNELIDEMKAALATGNLQPVTEIADDIKHNLEKIVHHGQRADAIVKGMLQHSRISGGNKELTDINVLSDEYLRLAFHGLRAKDKSFNAKFETDFDHSIGKINIIPQDIGRVLLNLINNAFYAVTEKKQENRAGFEPKLTVTTKKSGDKVLISVADNGNGIPQNIVDKIFQPFFTTKPTGEGTGLGLSLSYDIVKAHGGEIRVETKEGEGSEFIIELPL